MTTHVIYPDPAVWPLLFKEKLPWIIENEGETVWDSE